MSVFMRMVGVLCPQFQDFINRQGHGVAIATAEFFNIRLRMLKDIRPRMF